MKNILLIEDNRDLRENTKEILELANYQVSAVSNGKEGIEQALRRPPDLILCDILMPELDGYGVLHAIQKNESIRNTPFIFLTAKTEPLDFRKGMELGADDYISKPFGITDLLTAVESRLKKRERLREEITHSVQQSSLESSSGSTDPEQLLTQNRDTNYYKKKQVIYTEGNRPTRVFYVVKGKVKTSKRNEEGKELALAVYHEGEFFGYEALLEGVNYRETADALEDAEIALIPKEEFEKLLNGAPSVSRKFLKLLAKNMMDREEHLVGLAYSSLRKKVADSLVTLMKKYRPNSSGQFEFNISRDSLASLAGTATESLIRTLSDFRSEKIVDIINGAIVILDDKKLKRMLN